MPRPHPSVLGGWWGGWWMAVLVALGYALAQPPAGPPTTSVSRHADLHVRYTMARLRLAEARLRQAEALDRKFPGQVAETEFRSLRARVDLLRDEVNETRDQPHGYGFGGQRAAARRAVVLAEETLAEAIAINRRQPDVIQPLDLSVREILLELARLRAEIWDDPAFLASPTDVLQMQIDQLSDQLQDVLFQVENAPAMQRR